MEPSGTLVDDVVKGRASESSEASNSFNFSTILVPFHLNQFFFAFGLHVFPFYHLLFKVSVRFSSEKNESVLLSFLNTHIDGQTDRQTQERPALQSYFLAYHPSETPVTYHSGDYGLLHIN